MVLGFFFKYQGGVIYDRQICIVKRGIGSCLGIYYKVLLFVGGFNFSVFYYMVIDFVGDFLLGSLVVQFQFYQFLNFNRFSEIGLLI